MVGQGAGCARPAVLINCGNITAQEDPRLSAVVGPDSCLGYTGSVRYSSVPGGRPVCRPPDRPAPRQAVTPDEKYVLKLSVERASLIITNQTEPQINVTVTLTSPLMRDGAGDGGESAASLNTAHNTRPGRQERVRLFRHFF